MTDLLDTGETTPTHICTYTTLQSWQDALWQIATWATRWEVPGTRRSLSGDLFVTSVLGSEAPDVLDARVHVPARSVQYLSFAWGDPLDGVLDGLAEIAMQPDALVIDTLPLLIQARDEALAEIRPSASAQSRCVTLLWDVCTGVDQILDQRIQGRPVLIVDLNAISPDRLTRILAMEDADGGLVTYQR